MACGFVHEKHSKAGGGGETAVLKCLHAVKRKGGRAQNYTVCVM